MKNLKTWPRYFQDTLCGRKTFELRKDDRGFAVGDVLLLQEWDPDTHEYTGRELIVDVLYVLHGSDALFPGSLGSDFVIMSIRPKKMADDITLGVFFKRVMLGMAPQWWIDRRIGRARRKSLG